MGLGFVVKMALGLAVPCFVVWLVALLVGLPSGSVAAIVLLRTIGCVLTLALLTRVILRRVAPPANVGLAVALGGLFAYLISPQAWAGRALLAQIKLSPSVLTFVLDLVVWELVVLLAARSVQPAAQIEDHDRAPYGAGS